MTTTATKKLIQQLIFGGGHVNEESIEENIDKIEEEELRKGARRPSAYVDVFENVAKLVISSERHLLSDQELDFIEQFSKLCYNTRYCLVRLVLRKPNQWHPVSNLEKFKKEIGDDGLLPAIADLCQPIESLVKQEPYDDSQEQIKAEPVEAPIVVKLEPTPDEFRVKLEDDGCEIIDLTMEEEEDVKLDISSSAPASSSNCSATASSSKHTAPATLLEDPIQALLQSRDDEADLTFFCQDESAMSVQEILERLNVDQIKALAKEMKCKVKQSQSKKSDIIATLLTTAACQSVLSFASEPKGKGKGKGKAKDTGLRQTLLPFFSSGKGLNPTKKPINQEERLRQMAMKLLGKCVRVNFDVFRLFRRLHIVGYRETEHPSALLLPELLHRFKKRSYTRVEHMRSSCIWSSREDLLAYEKALHLESLLDDVIEGTKDSDKALQARAQSRPRMKEQFVTPGPSGHLTTPLRSPGSISNLHFSSTPAVKAKEEQGQQNFHSTGDNIEEPIVEIRKELVVKSHVDNWLYSMCKECVARFTQVAKMVAPGLERFADGYVCIRMLCKATSALGPLKEYEKEQEILNFLLSQTFWRRGKRAQWYRRRAIVQGHLIAQASSQQKKFELRAQCMVWLRDGLLDEDVGIVWRPDLINRLMKLEKQLKLPPEQRSTSDGRMRPPETIEVYAIKIANPVKFDVLGRPIEEKENTPDLLAYMIPKKESPKIGETGKSSWQGRDGIVNVETVALEHYENQGYTGFHSETRLLTTIFGLLFWDIIFADVPGAFETPFQFAPLDMFEDTFYHARKERIDARLKEIKDDDWRKYLQRHEDAYREKKTWCIGVSWELCSKEDLLTIFECIGKDSLAIICELFCQDYKGRSSGGPDLFVWKAKECVCKFVEVKGPGDRPQENQKYWFDSLHRAKVDVEICKVIDDNDKAGQSAAAGSKKRKAKTSSATYRRKGAPADITSDEVDYEALDLKPEDGSDFLAPDPADSPSRRKRRRISEPTYELEFPQQTGQVTFIDASTSLLVVSPSRPSGWGDLVTSSKIRH
ncbi:VRR-NUC domain-containing protein [Gymnopilus junonius]|uniref:Fanconi-associated nuclease n=1 Tax=Gymnopilus junonius TaxID=109634 RepID=A0A9P5P285_GYMJU|nr:VRR-NUC domain-containing protein [Gymnopilus junonius]